MGCQISVFESSIMQHIIQLSPLDPSSSSIAQPDLLATSHSKPSTANLKQLHQESNRHLPIMGLTWDQSPPSETHAEEPLRPKPQLEYWSLPNVDHYPGVARVSIGVLHRNFNKSIKFEGHPADIIYGSTEIIGVKKNNHWVFDIHDLRFREEASGAVWLLSAELFVDGVSIQTLEFPGIAVEPRSSRLSTPEIFDLELDEAPKSEDRKKPAGANNNYSRRFSIDDYCTGI
ncbi:unnamed protein product [Clonostachys rosea]|uniref:Uncharacterized protein n=1 Tax=Bionectria ochroleuca TaxID=29856 RepID=A0ABY6UCP8_BIOOC|nr:unnamed protein product [Clonostachys rosea]